MSAQILNFPAGRNREVPVRLVAEFSTRGVGPMHGRWTHLEIWTRGEGGLRCVKTRGHGETTETRHEIDVASLPEARPWFGGGWVVDELFKIAQGLYPSSKGLPRLGQDPSFTPSG